MVLRGGRGSGAEYPDLASAGWKGDERERRRQTSCRQYRFEIHRVPPVDRLWREQVLRAHAG